MLQCWGWVKTPLEHQPPATSRCEMIPQVSTKIPIFEYASEWHWSQFRGYDYDMIWLKCEKIIYSVGPSLLQWLEPSRLSNHGSIATGFWGKQRPNLPWPAGFKMTSFNSVAHGIHGIHGISHVILWTTLKNPQEAPESRIPGFLFLTEILSRALHLPSKLRKPKDPKERTGFNFTVWKICALTNFGRAFLWHQSSLADGSPVWIQDRLVAFNLCELHGHAWIQQAKDKMGGNNSIHEIRIWKQCVYIYICSFLQKVFGVSLQASFPSSPLALLFNSNKLALALLFLLGLSFVSMFLARKDTANQVSWLDEAWRGMTAWPLDRPGYVAGSQSDLSGSSAKRSHEKVKNKSRDSEIRRFHSFWI